MYYNSIFYKLLHPFRTEKNKFLFILSPPYCGSTLLNEIICTSSKVSVNNAQGTREGQGLPSVRQIMFDHDRRWDESLDFDWELIKSEWMKYWDLSAPILLEKSPPNIIRASSIQKNFKPSFFIILYRNPYALVESLMRREKRTPLNAAEFAIRCLEYQKRNIESLNNFIRLSYEELTCDPCSAKNRIKQFLPELSDIDIRKDFSAHNFKNEKLKIVNLNIEKIGKLTLNDMSQINAVFRLNQDTISFFHYEVLEDSI